MVSVLPPSCPMDKVLQPPQEKLQVFPFEMLYPILARLPSEEGYEEQEPDFAAAYYNATPESTVPGTLKKQNSAHTNVRYTRSRLPFINDASRDLWEALHNFRPLSASYAGNFQCSALRRNKERDSVDSTATCPMNKEGSSSSALNLIRKVFNWNELALDPSTEGSFYGVVFRSKRAPDSDDKTHALMMADKLSHEEAVHAGGLLMYWYGVADPVTGSNLATCIWSSREEARAASSLPLHRQAVKHAMKAYQDFELSRYRVVKRAGETGVRIEEWDMS